MKSLTVPFSLSIVAKVRLRRQDNKEIMCPLSTYAISLDSRIYTDIKPYRCDERNTFLTCPRKETQT